VGKSRRKEKGREPKLRLNRKCRGGKSKNENYNHLLRLSEKNSEDDGETTYELYHYSHRTNPTTGGATFKKRKRKELDKTSATSTFISEGRGRRGIGLNTAKSNRGAGTLEESEGVIISEKKD